MMPDYIGADARRIERIISIEIERNKELRDYYEYREAALHRTIVDLRAQVEQLEAELKREREFAGCIDESYVGD